VEGLRRAEDDAQRADPAQEFQVFVPVQVEREPSGGPGGFPAVERESAEAAMASWSTTGVGPLMQEPELLNADRFFEYSLKAPDRFAAAAQTADFFRAHADQWTLRGGLMSEPLRALVYDPSPPGAATLEGLPPEPLDLAPAELATHSLAHRDLEAAIAQVAQARSAATPGAALVDLWTAVEALLGGRGKDANIEAGLAMARMCPLPYVTDVTLWAGRRLENAGYGIPPAGGEIDWVHHDVLADRETALAKLRDALDPLGWLRLGALLAWEPGSGYAEEVARLRAHFERVARRAYIIRNTHVHEARRAYPGQAGTLRMFADLVRLTLGHALRTASLGPPLRQVTHAALEVDQVAERWGSKAWTRAQGLQRLT
jgi:hypothetical protein